MVRSMTGFGRAESARVLVEIKSVNHRYLDISVKMPRALASFDAPLRELIKGRLTRGKVDVFVTYTDPDAGENTLDFNEALASGYVALLGDIAERFGLSPELSAFQLSRFPDIITRQERICDDEETWRLIEETASRALDNLIAQREREGERLRDDILAKLSVMEEDVARIEALTPAILTAYRDRLYARIKETLSGREPDIDDVRIVSEVAIYCDKICTDEETVRLHSHIEQMRAWLTSGGGVGREMDFLLQEMMREANTILSKSSDLMKTATGVSLKTTIEKIREQVQNIE